MGRMAHLRKLSCHFREPHVTSVTETQARTCRQTASYVPGRLQGALNRPKSLKRPYSGYWRDAPAAARPASSSTPRCANADVPFPRFPRNLRFALCGPAHSAAPHRCLSWSLSPRPISSLRFLPAAPSASPPAFSSSRPSTPCSSRERSAPSLSCTRSIPCG